MALVVEGGYKDMTDADALAVAAYLKTVPAVENVPQMPEMAADEAAAPAEAPAALPVSGGERDWGMAIAILLGLGLMLLVADLWLQRNRLTAR